MEDTEESAASKKERLEEESEEKKKQDENRKIIARAIKNAKTLDQVSRLRLALQTGNLPKDLLKELLPDES